MSDMDNVFKRIELTNAIADLDSFTKHYCQNKDAEDLEFNCSKCPFCVNEEHCLIKRFAVLYKDEHDFDLSKFGSMN